MSNLKDPYAIFLMVGGRKFERICFLCAVARFRCFFMCVCFLV